MRVLFVTRWRPHGPDGGAALRNAQNIAALQELAEVDVFSIGRDEVAHPLPGIRHWQHHPRRVLRRHSLASLALHPGQHPLSSPYETPAAQQHFQRLLAENRYDLAVVEELALMAWAKPIRAAGIPLVFDAHNVEALLLAEMPLESAGLPGRLERALLARRLRRIERQAVRSADLIWACSPLDARALQRLYAPTCPVVPIANTIDLAPWAPARLGQARPVAAGSPIRLVFCGTFIYPPNEAAALELIQQILPRLRAMGAGVSLALVGRDPRPALVAAAKGDADVTLTGAVDSVRPWFSEPCLVPVPLRQGSGTRLKILEAFAAGAPVVSTAKGAEGIAISDGQDIRLADTPQEFAVTLHALWSDPAARAAQSAAAFALVEAAYSHAVARQAVHASLEFAGFIGQEAGAPSEG